MVLAFFVHVTEFGARFFGDFEEPRDHFGMMRGYVFLFGEIGVEVHEKWFVESYETATFSSLTPVGLIFGSARKVKFPMSFANRLEVEAVVIIEDFVGRFF